MVDRIVRSQTGPDAGREGGDEAAAPSAPWDLPPRRTHQPGWSAPPPWASNAKGGAGLNDVYLYDLKEGKAIDVAKPLIPPPWPTSLRPPRVVTVQP